MSSELPVGYESLRAERDRLESLLQTSEDWRALVQLRARKTRGEGLSEVNSDRLELMLRDALAENPAYGRFMAVCATMDRATGGKPRPPVIESLPGAQGSTDDLTRIRGIDANLARRLHALDVSSFEQIANWRAADIQKISDVLALGRLINSQNWIEQAAMLMPARVPDAKPAPVRAVVSPPQAAPKQAVQAAQPVVQEKLVEPKHAQPPAVVPAANPPKVVAEVVPVEPAKPEVPAIVEKSIGSAALTNTSIGVAPQTSNSASEITPPRPLKPVHYLSATRAQNSENRNQPSTLPNANTQNAKPASLEAAGPASGANATTGEALKQVPPRPLVVQQAVAQPAPVTVPKAPVSPPPPPPAQNTAAAPPPLPKSAATFSGVPSEIKPPADAVAWALDRALEAIKSSKQSTAVTSAVSATDATAAAVAAAAEKIIKPTPAPAPKPTVPAAAAPRNGAQPPPLPPSVWQLAESAQSAAVRAAVVVPRSSRGIANGRLDRDELALAQLNVEEASVEIVRRPPSNAILAPPPAPLPTSASAELIADPPKADGRGGKPLGRFLKALTGNS